MGIFPTLLKTSKVIPIFRNKGSPMNASNYRPSLFYPILRRFMKRWCILVWLLLIDIILFMLDNLDFVKVIQLSMLLLTSQSVLGNVLTKVSLLGVYLSIYKRPLTLKKFKILLSKLDHHGIRGCCDDWFRSYLSERLQFVTICNSNSSSRQVSYGVPQGSVLGPLLFLIYINDLHLAIKHSETFHFADDTHLLHFAKTISSLCSKINADLRILTCWLNANKISLNFSKTEFILFRSRSKPLNLIPFLKLLDKRIYPNSSVKYLGTRSD